MFNITTHTSLSPSTNLTLYHELFKKFREKNIIVRRYFYPLISDFAIYKKIYTAKTTTSLKNAKKMSAQVLCLPIYPGLDRNEIYEICKVIKDYKKE